MAKSVRRIVTGHGPHGRSKVLLDSAEPPEIAALHS